MASESPATGTVPFAPLGGAAGWYDNHLLRKCAAAFAGFPAPDLVPETQDKYYEWTNTWGDDSGNLRNTMFSGGSATEPRGERGGDRVRAWRQLRAVRSCRGTPLPEAVSSAEMTGLYACLRRDYDHLQ